VRDGRWSAMNALFPPVEMLPAPCCFALVGPLSALSFLLQLVAMGSAIGAAVALRAIRRRGHADVWRITTAWATLALILGVLIELFSLWL
jgi:hypothetical protein